VYSDLVKKPNYDLAVHTNKACCLYALGRYKEAFEEAKKGISSELNVNIQINIYKLDKSEIPLCI
jgi:hypothetical protein